MKRQAIELLDANVMTPDDLYGWLKAKNSGEATHIGFGLPCFSLVQTILRSIQAGLDGFPMFDGFELNQLNRLQDKVLRLVLWSSSGSE